MWVAQFFSRNGAFWRNGFFYVQILLALALGAALGAYFKTAPFWSGGNFGNQQLGEMAGLITTLLKTLATPLVFFAVLDAFVRTEISWERGRKLLQFSLINVSVAMLIGLLVMNLFHPGQVWSNQFSGVAPVAGPSRGDGTGLARTLGESLLRLVPHHILQPFVQGDLLTLILLAALLGSAYRSVRAAGEGERVMRGQAFEQLITFGYEIFLRMLEWVVQLLPLAVMGAVASSVATIGADVVRHVTVFLAAILGGMTMHAFGYYTLVAWSLGRPPHIFLGRGMQAILTGFTTNSSLATVPVTLRTLTEEMGVSDQSARLSACVGTNFNNDGITLYEAMTAIFLAQAIGLPLTWVGQLQTVMICVLASLGAAGIPQGGIAVLPLVLAATGLTSEMIAIAMPMILTVDWIIARYRSAVNVMGDMIVAIQLDASARQ